MINQYNVTPTKVLSKVNNLRYIVKQCERAMGQTITLKSKEFEWIEDAIDFHRNQKDGYFSWWVIEVTYDD